MPLMGWDPLNDENRPLYWFVGSYDLHEHCHDGEVSRITNLLWQIKSIIKSGVNSVHDYKLVLGFYSKNRWLFLRSITELRFAWLLQTLYQGHRIIGTDDINPERAMTHLIREFIHSAWWKPIETEIIPSSSIMVQAGEYSISWNHEKVMKIRNRDMKSDKWPAIKYGHVQVQAWDDYDRLAKLSDKDLMEWYLVKMEWYRWCHSKWWVDEASTPVCAECKELIDGPKQLIRIYRNSVHRICLPSFRRKRWPEKNPWFNILLDRIQRITSL